MFSFFFTKTQQAKPKKDLFEFPKHPCYAAVVEKYLVVDIEKYFSGALDAKLAIVELFENADAAVTYLKGTPSAKGGYLFCLDQELDIIKQIMREKKGFGERIVQAINFDDYIGTTSEFHPLSSDQVKVIYNPRYKERRTTSSDQ